MELHIFVDASDKAMAAVAYAWPLRGAVEGRGALIQARIKAAPLKTKSIPRQELDTAVLGTRILDIIRSSECWAIDRVTM